MAKKKLKPWQQHLDEWLIFELNARKTGDITKVDRDLYARKWHAAHGTRFGVTLRQVELFTAKCIEI